MLQGLSSEEAEKCFVAKVDPDKTLSAWKDLENTIAKWKVKEDKTESKQTDVEKVPEDKEKKKSSDPRLSRSSDPRLSKSSDIGHNADPRIPKESMELSKSDDSQNKKPQDPRLSKSADPRLSKSSDPRLSKVEKQKSPEPSVPTSEPENNEFASKTSELNVLPIFKQDIIVSADLNKENDVKICKEVNDPELMTFEADISLTQAEVDELDTIAQFLESSM